MADIEFRMDWKELKAFTKEVFVRAGLSDNDAEIVADVLVWANLRGVDSHGVLRIPWYTGMLESGDMNPRPDVKVIKETPAIMFIDADRAAGPVITVWAMKKMIEKARNVGIGWCLIRDHTHQGAMAYYPLIAVKENMAGIAMVNNPPNMAPYGAKVRGLHNSPISFAFPAKKRRPVVLDMATSVAAGGKLSLAIDKGVPIPLGWALDGDGKPTTDPKQSRALLPVGGPKGSGLSMVIECLTSVMANNPLAIRTLMNKPRKYNSLQNSAVAAIDISMFMDPEEYKDHIDTFVDCLKELPKADGFDEILVPGEPEDKCYDERVKNGIPLPEGTINNLRNVTQKLGFKFPLSWE